MIQTNEVALTTLVIITLVIAVMVLVVVGNIYHEIHHFDEALKDALSRARAP
jgi:hypothetical protein